MAANHEPEQGKRRSAVHPSLQRAAMADAARCISRRSALRFWEEKCGVNGLGRRGLQNTAHGQTEDRSVTSNALRSSVPLNRLHALRQPDSGTSKVRL